jgi:hypothetical protein
MTTAGITKPTAGTRIRGKKEAAKSPIMFKVPMFKNKVT